MVSKAIGLDRPRPEKIKTESDLPKFTIQGVCIPWPPNASGPRYPRRTTLGHDRYNELYLGVNYYFYGHKLKLQGGVTFADMRDSANDGGSYSGVAATTGLRVSW